MNCYFLTLTQQRKLLWSSPSTIFKYFHVRYWLSYKGFFWGEHRYKWGSLQKAIFSFSKCSEKMIFPKNRTRIWSFLYYQERWYFFFPKISYYSLDGKGKMIFLKKNIWNYDIFFKCSERWSFQKKYIGIWTFLYYLERWYFFPRKTWYFLFGRKMKDDLSREINGNMIFSVYVYKC